MEFEIEKKLFKANTHGSIGLILPDYLGLKIGDVVVLNYDTENEGLVVIRRR